MWDMPAIHVIRTSCDKGRYVVVDGDPRDRNWASSIGAQRLLPKNRLHEMYRSLSGSDIIEHRVINVDVIGVLGQPVDEQWEGYRLAEQLALTTAQTPVA